MALILDPKVSSRPAAAAHALDLAGAGSVRQIDIKALQARLYDNLERCD